MRSITDHRFEDGGFNESIQGLVRNSPWWMMSAVVHALALVILWNIPWQVTVETPVATIRSHLAEKPEDIEETIDEDIRIDRPEDIVEVPDVVEPEPPSSDTESEDNETTGESEGIEGPFTSVGDVTAIGLTGGPGGGTPGGGGSRHVGVTGGTQQTQDAVLAGLKWLKDHQDEDGRWDCDDFMKHDPADDKCDGAGGQLYDVGVSGMAMLAFFGAGFTHRGSSRENPFAGTVRRGLRYLQSVQDEDGLLGSRSAHNFIYNHAIGTLALCEAYWMTRSPRLKRPAQQALNYLIAARNPYMAWRYEPRGGENDTSVTGWAVMALKSGRWAGLEVDPTAFEGARQWIDKMTGPNFGQVGYNFPGGPPARPEGKQDRFPPGKSQSMTAVGILTRIFLGEDPRVSEPIRKGARLCMDALPVWNPDDGSIDMYYWYYGTLAMFQVGGAPWKKWNVAMKKAIVSSQHGKGAGARTGSWDPIGCWGDDGGRVYATAAMVMCLEVYYRYDRVVGVHR